MSLFGIKPVTEGATVDSTEYSYVGECAELNEILFESAKDIHQIQSGLYVADIMMESQVVYEGASEEVLIEGVVKDFFDKVIESFKKLWAKITAWFKNMYKNLESFFLPGEKFIKKYEKELNAKETKGFTYQGYKYNKSFVDGLYAFRDAEKSSIPTFNSVADLYKAVRVGNVSDKFTSQDLEKAKKNTLAHFSKSAENISELKKEILEAACGDEKEEISNFAVYSVKEMMTFIKGKSKIVDALKKAQKINDKNLQNMIKGMESLKKSLSSEHKAKYSASISNCASLARYDVAITNAFVECAVTLAKRQFGEFSGALRSLLRYKGTKEGFGYMNEENNSSIFESAINFL